MLWSCDVILCPKLPQKVLEGLINEMRPSVTYDHSGRSEMREYDLVDHLSGMLGINSSAW
jgi:hypothetical protein